MFKMDFPKKNIENITNCENCVDYVDYVDFVDVINFLDAVDRWDPNKLATDQGFLCINPYTKQILTKVKNKKGYLILTAKKIYNRIKDKNFKIKFLPDDLKKIISSYLPKYELLDWIKYDDLIFSYDTINKNENIINIIKNDKNLKDNINDISKNPKSSLLVKEYIKNNNDMSWDYICQNPELIDIIEEDFNNGGKNICWSTLMSNKNALHLIEYGIKHLNENILNLYYLAHNVNAIHLIKNYIKYYLCLNNKNKLKLIFNGLCYNENPEAICLLNYYYLDLHDIYGWYILCDNPKFISVIENDIKYNNGLNIKWCSLCKNSNAIDIIKNDIKCNNGRNIKWYSLCENTDAIDIIENDINYNDAKNIEWYSLCSNPNAIHLIENDIKFNNGKNIRWSTLCINPKAIHIIENEIDFNDGKNIDWHNLCKNINAIEIIKKNFNKIKHTPNLMASLTNNPSIIKLNYRYLYDNILRYFDN